jgi:L-alanine-DL-glutamate epimerase-like enolase superfamily enzyme
MPVTETWRGLIRVITDEGVEGNAFFGSGPLGTADFSRNGTRDRASHILGRIKPEMVGRSVYDREWLWAERYVMHWWGKIDHRALAAVDVALWDAAAKAAGLPLHRLLGSCRDRVPAYASGPHLGPLPENIGRHVELIQESKRRGYQAFKLKPGGGSVAAIKQLCTEARKAAGDDMGLMIDGQLYFTGDQALEIGGHLQDLGFLWWEDPVRHNDAAAIDRLTQLLHIPVALSDHEDFGFEEAAATIMRTQGSLRIVRGDSMTLGVTGLKKLCSVAEAYGLNCEVHMPGPANLAVILSIRNCDWYEDNLGWYRTGASDSGIVDSEGYVHAPSDPGVGFQVEGLEKDREERLS